LSHAEIARVLFEQRGQNCFRHHVLRGLIGKGRGEALAKGAPTLSPGRRVILGLTDRRKDARNGIGVNVEGVRHREPELVLGA